MNNIFISKDIGQLRQMVPAGTNVVLLYDRNVSVWMEKAADPSWITIPLEGGEDLKQWKFVQQVIDRFLELQVDRSWFLIGMGGGTVCDFAGFIGSVYMRGMPFALVPTTLLAQVDAALGGKNGIHAGPYKNMIGCTVLPRWVFCHPGVLSTLPAREFRCGLAECIKHGAIAGEIYFRFLEEEVLHRKEFQDYSPEILHKLISGSQEIKMGIVEQDLYEKGVRKVLNFGHTFGHALAARYPELSHGEAVAKGMAAGALYSVQKGMLSQESAHRLLQAITSAGLDPELPCTQSDLITYMLHDKKKQGKTLGLVLLRGIGQHVLVNEPVEKLKNALSNPGVSLGAQWEESLSRWLEKAPWVELRLDLMGDITPIGMVALRMQCMGKEKKILLTYPVDPECTQIPGTLQEMISWGAGWVDIPVKAASVYKESLSRMARDNGAGIIQSVHFWENPGNEIPGKETLDALVREAFSTGADYLKIAVYTYNERQSDDLLAWCDEQNAREGVNYRITVMIMGEDALRTRKHALSQGYPFVYAASATQNTTAPGQPSFEALML
ncbi:MAG: type I 3-dehydroquinate dehydratase [Bacteroidales bacterium]|jgi:3-dehydroquinate synthase